MMLKQITNVLPSLYSSTSSTCVSHAKYNPSQPDETSSFSLNDDENTGVVASEEEDENSQNNNNATIPSKEERELYKQYCRKQSNVELAQEENRIKRTMKLLCGEILKGRCKDVKQCGRQSSESSLQSLSPNVSQQKLFQQQILTMKRKSSLEEEEAEEEEETTMVVEMKTNLIKTNLHLSERKVHFNEIITNYYQTDVCYDSDDDCKYNLCDGGRRQYYSTPNKQKHRKGQQQQQYYPPQTRRHTAPTASMSRLCQSLVKQSTPYVYQGEDIRKIPIYLHNVIIANTVTDIPMLPFNTALP